MSVSFIDGHIDGADTCAICGRDIPEGSQHCVICGYKAEKKKADLVEVVRCKDCKYCEFEEWDEDILCGCLHPSGLNDVSPNAFCSYGERKGKE